MLRCRANHGSSTPLRSGFLRQATGDIRRHYRIRLIVLKEQTD